MRYLSQEPASWREVSGRLLGVCLASLLGCSTGVEPPRDREPSPAVTEPRPAAPAPPEPGQRPADAGPAATSAKAGYEKQLPLAGNVRFKLLGKCTGCRGGTLELEAKVRGSEIELLGEVVGCEGACPTYRAATGAVVVKRLKQKTYTVRSSLRVLEVEPLTLSSSARAEWAIFLMSDSCAAGIESLNGNEKVTTELREAFDRCYAKVTPELQFQTISNMLTWKNQRAYVPELIKALGNTKTAYLAARVLGRTEDRSAIAPLIEALSAGDESLRWDAARSLEMITGEELGQDQARWRAWHASQAER